MDATAGKDITPTDGIPGVLSHWKGEGIVVDQDFRAPATMDPATGKEIRRTTIPKLNCARPLLRGAPIEPGRTVVTNDRRSDPDKPRNYLAEWPSGKAIRPVDISTKDGFSLEVVGLSSDERLLVLNGEEESTLLFWEIASGKVRFRLKPASSASVENTPGGRLILIYQGDKKTIFDSLTYEAVWEMGMFSDAAFSANGKLLVTGQLSSLIVWDARTALPRKTSAEKLTGARLRELWDELRSDDAQAAHRAMVAFARRPEESVAFLRSRLPDAPVEATYRRLLVELDDPVFKTRDAAQIEMEKFGPVAGQLIRRTLENPPSVEVQRRLSAVLEKLAIPAAERLRWLRTSELLERIGTPPAAASLRLLREFSDVEISADATRSLERIARYN